MMNLLGPDRHISSFGKIHFVQFSPDGVFGWILKHPVLIDIFLSGTSDKHFMTQFIYFFILTYMHLILLLFVFLNVKTMD